MFDPATLLQWFGPFVLIGVFVVIFAECGTLAGLVLPGDPLLFTAGLFATAGVIHVDLWLVCLVGSVAAITGNVCGYWIGAKVGPVMFDRPNSRFLKQSQVESTHRFFDKYGAPSIILARFIPLARTLITAIAGVGGMDPKRYFLYSTIGGVLWAAGMTLLGGLLGQIPWVRDNVSTMLFIMFIAIMIVSIVPIGNAALKRYRRKKVAEIA